MLPRNKMGDVQAGWPPFVSRLRDISKPVGGRLGTYIYRDANRSGMFRIIQLRIDYAAILGGIRHLRDFEKQLRCPEFTLARVNTVATRP